MIICANSCKTERWDLRARRKHRSAVTRVCLSIFDLRPSEGGVAAGQLCGRKQVWLPKPHDIVPNHSCSLTRTVVSDFVRFTQICSDQKYFLVGKSGERRGKVGNYGKWKDGMLGGRRNLLPPASREGCSRS